MTNAQCTFVYSMKHYPDLSAIERKHTFISHDCLHLLIHLETLLDMMVIRSPQWEFRPMQKLWDAV